MMEKSIYEEALDGATVLINEAMGDFEKQFKNTKPIQSDITPEEQIWSEENLGTEDFNELVQEFGQEEMGKLLYEINRLKTDGRRRYA